MKGKVVVVAGLLAGLFLLAQGAMACRWTLGPWKGCGYWAKARPCWSRIPLEKASEVQELYLKEVLPLREKLIQKKFELKRLWLKEKPDLQRILSLQKEIFAIKAEIAEKTARLRLKVMKALK
ncbi:MAG: hypothetical protein DRG55_03620 [Deltaproteobacteria bacterium]|nr:MAG: hypothetical protein DRG55_03620 [Deltaproteobacteria bacterium]